MKKKRILVLASTFPRWKNDTKPPFVFELEKRLAKDFEIHILAPHHFGAKKEEKMEGLFIHRFQYSWPARGQKLCDDAGILPNLKENKLLYFQAVGLIVFELIAALQLCRKYKFDLIHAHWIIPQGIIAIIINKIFGIPYILTSHGGDIYGLSGKIFTHLKKAILENAKTITVVSSAIKNEVLRINPTLNSKTEVIPMGVDSKLFNPDKYDESIKKKYNITGPFLLFVGRLVEKKGVKYLLEAMPAILKSQPKAKLLIIGTGSEEERLKNLSMELEIKNNVEFLGAIPHNRLPKYYATADYFVSLSIEGKDGDKDGLPTSLIEASFSGCILISTNFGSFSELVEDGKTGYLIDISKSNSLPMLIDKKINNNIDEMKEMIRKTNILKFGIESISKKISILYSQS